MSESTTPGTQANLAYVEEMFLRYQANPNSVDAEWRGYFQGFHEGFDIASHLAENSSSLQDVLSRIGSTNGNGYAAHATAEYSQGAQASDAAFESRVTELIVAYRRYGHLRAKLDPLGRPRRKFTGLELENFGLTQNDLTRDTHAGVAFGFSSNRLSGLIAELESRFCGTVGVEFEHVTNPEERRWLYEKFYGIYNGVNNETRRSLYTELARADAVEKTIATKYIGKKRFSIEGADAQIPALESFMDKAAALGAKEFSLAMAHRGRLTILVEVVKKPLQQLFAEFEGYPNLELTGDGDVKYHGGYESQRTTRSGAPIHVSLSFNPSHLEFVDCVVVGETRAKQDRYHESNRDAVIPIVLHGDAAVSGQGVVYETVQMMRLRGYDVGGTIHIVANNQLGFTTNPYDSRSGDYCTDVAKVVNAPVFHVNADDIDALHNIMELSAEYRLKFHKDIFVDIVCFRRHGHNETDEPNYTQPMMYKLIRQKPSPYEGYLKHLTSLSSAFDESSLLKVYSDAKAEMNATFDRVKAEHTKIELRKWQRAWENLRMGTEQDLLAPVKTSVEQGKLKALAATISEVDASFHPHPKIAQSVINPRKEMAEGKRPLDWGMAELLAYATLLDEGKSVRLAGQDSGRGTFSHRHAALVDTESDARVYPTANAAKQGALFEVVDSLLSETAAMGYEYGYAVRHEKALVLWEAQFGDFVNGAQVIIDQFVVSGETKWAQSQGLVLLLPHGFEGMGPEHSSARPERFLQMAAQGNIQVCYLTSASNLFHALRRQVVRDFRKPLVIMTPKSFIRNPRVFATFEDLSNGEFQEILDDNRHKDGKKITQVVLCAGKIAVELMDAAEKSDFAQSGSEIAFLRLEQLYPFAEKKIAALLKKYKGAKNFIWVQEEPKNMGPYPAVASKLAAALKAAGIDKPLHFGGRSERASPSVGLEKQHLIEQEKLIQAVFDKKEGFEI